MPSEQFVLSVVVPVFNEAAVLEDFHKDLTRQLDKDVAGAYEIIYCDDGSTDKTSKIIGRFRKANPSVKLLRLSRNFGKESALTAGITAARGRAILTIDGDGQHPPGKISDFLKAWQEGAKVIVGVRTNKAGNWRKRAGSRLFYGLFNRLTGQRLVPGSTDFRLIDRSVQQEFLNLKESDRITRGLIDWLGFKRDYVHFEARKRYRGSPGYSTGKLFRLAANSFVSLTPKPLYLFGYLGIFITFGALVLGGAVLVEQVILGDPARWNFTGTAMIGILLLFLVGIILMSQGMLSLYVSHIHSQSKARPLYIIDREASAGIDDETIER